MAKQPKELKKKEKIEKLMYKFLNELEAQGYPVRDRQGDIYVYILELSSGAVVIEGGAGVQMDIRFEKQRKGVK